MRRFKKVVYASVSLLTFSAPALAQSTATLDGATTDSGDIIVTARRKDESIQDVPLTVNAVSAETIQKLNIRELKDISAVVPGLNLSPGITVSGPIASLRGVNVNVISSGNNGTVEFYLNDAPISAGVVLHSIYDIGQIEVLRGPQGTLRGRASPSGSITVTTRRPDMNEFGGYAEATVTSLNGINVQGAINVPIIKDVLALRVAGLVENNQANRVFNINSAAIEPSSKTRAFRASLRFTPTDNIEVNASYSHLEKNIRVYDQVESANLALSLPVVGTLVTARDRRAVSDVPRINHQAYDIFNWQARWSFAGQRLDYVGNYSTADLIANEPLDKGNAFGDNYGGNAASATPNLQNLSSFQHSLPRQESHELRLSSEERLFGVIDYVIGGLINRLEPPTDLISRTPVFLGPVSPANFFIIAETPNARRGRTIERAAFGNLTVHLGENTEISGGVRYLNFKDNGNTPGNATDLVYSATIWSGSIKHRFSDDLMVYASTGSSWRLSTGTNPLILARSGITTDSITDPFLASLFNATPERSKSYEIGLRSTWLDKKLIVNLSAYHQVFDGYIFATPPVFVASYNSQTQTYANPVRTVAGLAASVPAKVDGIEAEIAFRPSDRFELGVSMAYAKSKITNGKAPCSPGTNPPSLADVQGSVISNTNQVLACTINQSASTLAPFSASVQSEFSHPVTESMDGFIRGLVNIKGNSLNDPTNPYDDVPAYALANLYVGVRAADRSWEIMGYAKNLFNTFRVLTRDASPSSLTVAIGQSPTTVTSNYRIGADGQGMLVTEPREFGITARISFGSR